MPTTINGIGTRYVGKADLTVRGGVCESCRKPADLSSYDTRLWFCILFIPIVPLGRKRVIDECGRCRRHRALPLEQYRELQEETLLQLRRESERRPADLDRMIEYNSALLDFGRSDEAKSHLGELLRAFEDDARAQYYAALVCRREGRAEEARRFFDLSFKIDPTFAPARQEQAARQIEQGNLDQAAKLLAASSIPAEEIDPSLLFLLAQAYRERGDHVNAMEIDQRLVRDFPGIDQSKELRKAVRTSEKALGSPRTILGERQRSWGRLGLAAGVVALLVGGALVFNWYRSSHHRVHVVNGYPGTVRVLLDGERGLDFSEVGRLTVEVAEGAHRIEVGGDITDLVEFRIERRFWSRFRGDPVWVVNLGGLAVLMQEDVSYAARVEDAAEPQTRLLAGDSFTVVEEVDFAFRDFPEEVDLPTGKGSVQKRRLSVLEGEPEQLAGWVLAEGDAESALRYVEAWLAVEPSDGLALTYASLASMVGEPERAAATLRPRLTVRPTNVDWHRAYQQALLAQPRRHDALLAEYEEHLAGAPDDPDLLYLRGRIDPSPEGALAHYSRALAVAPLHTHALGASGWTRMALGDFAEAAALLRPGANGEAGEELEDLYLEALVAAGDDAAVRRLLRPRLVDAAGEFRWDDALRLALVEVRSGNPEQAAALVAQLTEAAGEAAEPFHPWIQSRILYAAHDLGALRQLVRNPRFPYPFRPEIEFWLAVESGDLTAATRSAMESGGTLSDGSNELVVALLHAKAGREEAAREWAARGVEAAARQRADAAVAAELLAGERPLTPHALDLLLLEPRYKAAILTLLAVRYPDERGWLLAEADRFNYTPQFPHHFLKSFADE